MEDSIFTKIVNGEIPAEKIYEDEHTLAFLDIHPSVPGHTMVIPKRQVEFLWDLNDEDYQAVMATSKLVARHIREVLGVPYVGVKVVGVDVPHAHVHLIPFSTTSEFMQVADMNADPDFPALKAMSEKLRF